jgi:glucokinase
MGNMETILAGDVGATKTHLALFEKERWIRDAIFKSCDYESLEDIIDEFLEEKKEKISKACFGMPGIVIDGKCHPTNLPWLVEEKKIEKALSIPSARLINDLEANAYGLSCLQPQEYEVLNVGVKKMGNQALISAGTGLGEAGLFWDGKEHRPFATEGGHASFAPENEEEVELCRYLKKSFSHLSFERILSGQGLAHLYAFLGGVEKLDPKAITEKGLGGSCPICKRALEIFGEIYGGEAGNLALKFFSVGGLFIGGGIAPKILPILKSGAFMKRFCAKGRMASFLLQIPVFVILNENTALLGAAAYARR